MSISVMERKIAPQRCSCLNPQWTIHVYIVDQFRSLIEWPWVKKLPWVIRVSLIKSTVFTQWKKQTEEVVRVSVIWCWGIKSTRADFEGRERRPWAKECRPFLKAGSNKEMKSPLKSPESSVPCSHLEFSPVTLIEFLTSRTGRQNPVVPRQSLVMTAVERSHSALQKFWEIQQILSPNTSSYLHSILHISWLTLNI